MLGEVGEKGGTAMIQRLHNQLSRSEDVSRLQSLEINSRVNRVPRSAAVPERFIHCSSQQED
jgi:hypothetical protein